MSANEQGIIAVTGMAHCKRQVALLRDGGRGYWSKIQNSTSTKRGITYFSDFSAKTNFKGVFIMYMTRWGLVNFKGGGGM